MYKHTSKMSKEEEGYRRRSSRIWALEEAAKFKQKEKEEREKELKEKQKEKLKGKQNSPPSKSQPDSRRGRKKKRLEEVVVSSVARDGEKNPKHEEPLDTDQPATLTSSQPLPEKSKLEAILDILQKRDTHEIFAEPVDGDEVEGYYDVIKEPMDFGTMRAKLQEGMYKTLDQFEHDIFLMSSNAMLFNASNTIYFRQARALRELSQKVFDVLKTSPETLELEFSQMRKRPQKTQGEGNVSNLKASGIGTSSNGRSSSRRNTQASRVGRRDVLSGSRGGRNLNTKEMDKRRTYRPWTSFASENDSLFSAVKESKQLIQIENVEGGYRESLMRFVKDLGPIAQMVANRKLAGCLVRAPSSQSVIPASSFSIRNYLLPASTSQSGLPHPGAVTNSPMPPNFHGNLPGDSSVFADANAQLNIGGNVFSGQNVHSCNSMDIHSGAYKGKMVCPGRTNIPSTIQGGNFPANSIMGTQTALQGERAYAATRKNTDDSVLGIMTVDTSSIMDYHKVAREEIIHAIDKMDLFHGAPIEGSTKQKQNTQLVFREAFREDSSKQKQNAQIQSSSYFPIIGIKDLNSLGSNSTVRGDSGKQKQNTQIWSSSYFPATGIENLNPVGSSSFIREDSSKQNQNAQIQSASFFPIAGIKDLNSVGSTEAVKEDSSMQNQNSQIQSGSYFPLNGMKDLIFVGSTGADKEDSSNQKQNTQIQPGSYFPFTGIKDMNTVGSTESVREDYNKQKQKIQIHPSSYFPITRIQDLNSVGSTGTDDLNSPPIDTSSRHSMLGLMMESSPFTDQYRLAHLLAESQSKLFEFMSKNESSFLSSQAANMASSAYATTTVHGLGSDKMGGENLNDAPLIPNYGAISAREAQLLEWSRVTPWGLQAIHDFPFKKMTLGGMIPFRQDALIGLGGVNPFCQVGQGSQQASAPTGPFIDAVRSYDRGSTQGYQPETSAQQLGDLQQQQQGQASQQPDLVLQL